MLWRSWPVRYAALAATIVSATVALADGSETALARQRATVQRMAQFPPVDRTRLPTALRNVPLDRLSSGALLLLNQNNRLVLPAAKPQARVVAEQAPPATLDPRLNGNLRLGDDPGALPATARAQAEPHVIRSPVDPDFLAGVFQEGRLTNGGAVDCGYSISHDGGLHWSRALVPKLTKTVGGPFFRASDPVAGIDLAGNVFLNTIVATNSNFTTGAVVVSRSTDGGASFGAPLVVYQPPGGTLFPDKNWLAINTFAGTPHAGRVVVTFTLFSAVNGSEDDGAPIVCTFSDDAGATWSSLVTVNPGGNTQGSQPVFLPDGRLAVAFWDFGTKSNPGERIEIAISNDGGATFGAPKLMANVARFEPAEIRSGSFLPSMTADRATGNLCIVYQALVGTAPRILFAKSADAGTTWTPPIAITDNPVGAGVFNPAIAASPDGQTLVAVFYDERLNPNSTTLVDLFLAQSFDAGATWQPNIRVSSVTTDATLAPLTPMGYMLGDYLAVAAPAGANIPAVPIWIDTRTGGPDPFIARAAIAPAFAFASWQAARLSAAQINNPQTGGESGDADSDGEDNLAEFRAGTDPVDGSSVVRSARSLNLSTRLFVQTGDNVLIGGFILAGHEAKRVLIRGLGPSLGAADVPGALADPVLELHQGSALLAANDDWKETAQAEIEATSLQPGSDFESALVQTLDPGPYTAILRGKDGATGAALVEVYDLSGSAGSKLANISTRGYVGTGDQGMIGGFIVGSGWGTNGAGSSKVVVRAIGPSLVQAGVASALTDPALELRDANGALIAANDNWKEAQKVELIATGLAPSDDRESALIATLTQGNYTAIVRGQNATTGVALVEVYNVP